MLFLNANIFWKLLVTAKFLPLSRNHIRRYQKHRAKTEGIFSLLNRSVFPILTYSFPLLSILLAISFSSQAKANIFSGAKGAMDCVVKNAGTNDTNAIISKLPAIVFTAIELIIFAYIVVSLVQVFQSARAGEEVTQMIIPPLSAIIGIVIIMILQNILFSGGVPC